MYVTSVLVGVLAGIGLMAGGCSSNEDLVASAQAPIEGAPAGAGSLTHGVRIGDPISTETPPWMTERGIDREVAPALIPACDPAAACTRVVGFVAVDDLVREQEPPRPVAGTGAVGSVGDADGSVVTPVSYVLRDESGEPIGEMIGGTVILSAG